MTLPPKHAKKTKTKLKKKQTQQAQAQKQQVLTMEVLGKDLREVSLAASFENRIIKMTESDCKLFYLLK